jgi:uncharacterized protein
LILFAHGAGASSASAWMKSWSARLALLGTVRTFDYSYLRQGRKTPDRLPALIAAHREALSEAMATVTDPAMIVLAGKSMGSRVGCHLAVELTREKAAPQALICFGYPLRSGSSGALRDEVLRALNVPILFVQGSKDPLCPLADLDKVRKQMIAPSDLFVVPGGNHSLEVGVRELKATGKTQDDWNHGIVQAIDTFLRKLVPVAGRQPVH